MLNGRAHSSRRNLIYLTWVPGIEHTDEEDHIEYTLSNLEHKVC